MNAHDIARLVRRLEAGSISACEFDDSDGASLRLRFAPAPPDTTPAPPPTAPLAPVCSALPQVISAPRFGLYLHRHPLSDAGRVEPGQAFEAGDTLGFIQAGERLLPVQAAAAGSVSRLLVAHGALVGHGQALISIR